MVRCINRTDKLKITLNEIFGRIDLVKDRDCVGSCFSCSVLGSCQDVSA